NTFVRDRLPDYVHGTLSPGDAASVQAHLERCDDCREELELLRTVHRAWAPVNATAPDVAAIVRALPRPVAGTHTARPAVPQRAPRRFAPARWQLAAAAVVLVAIGALSATGIPWQRQGEPAPAISFAGGVNDLDATELEALVQSIDEITATPVAEPEHVAPLPMESINGASE
ncbi:MAG TPA: zf-HC2 domain-containing protein, partial [Gemmatimonadaceae bacterium]|nr:zf-HC2 domain-containing protein [Gemmatimonadaceae bacterium]